MGGTLTLTLSRLLGCSRGYGQTLGSFAIEGAVLILGRPPFSLGFWKLSGCW